MITRTALAATLGALLTLTGCVSYRGVAPGEIAPRTEINVHFAAPQEISFRASGDDSLTYTDVVEVQGRVIAINGDSVTIAATNANRGDAGTQRFGPGTIATFTLANARLQEVQRHKGRTIALVTALVLGVALLIAVATYEEPPPPPPPEPKVK